MNKIRIQRNHKKKLSLTVVAPVYNEEGTIEIFYTQLKQILSSLKQLRWTILFAVDPGTDNTISIIQKIVNLDPRVIAIELSTRFGHQAAILAGIEYAKDSDLIVMMDSDLQHPPELIPQMINAYCEGNEIVYTTRLDLDNSLNLRDKIGICFYKIINSLSTTSIKSNSADFRLITQKVARVLTGNFSERRLFLRGLFPWIGFRQIGLEYKPNERYAGESKYNLSKSFQLALSGIIAFSDKPLYLGVLIGLMFTIVALVLIVWVIISYAIGKSIPDGWSTLIVLMLLFHALQLFVIGIIGVYIAVIVEQVKARPRYIISRILTKSKRRIVV